MIRTWIIFSLIILVVCSTVMVINVYAVNTTTIDNSGRREYGYCPIAPETMLSRAEFEINGCPLVRTYITNWDRLTITEQTTIDSQLRALGFKDISEFDSRVK